MNNTNPYDICENSLLHATIVRMAHLALLVVLVATGMTACGSSSTPPGADEALGSVAQGGYLFLRWPEGLEVMIWHDLAGEGTADSAGTPAVRQLQRDLSVVPLDHDGILAFARNDPDLAAFLDKIPPATSPTATPAATLTATPTPTSASTSSATPSPPAPTATPLPPTQARGGVEP